MWVWLETFLVESFRSPKGVKNALGSPQIGEDIARESGIRHPTLDYHPVSVCRVRGSTMLRGSTVPERLSGYLHTFCASIASTITDAVSIENRVYTWLMELRYVIGCHSIGLRKCPKTGAETHTLQRFPYKQRASLRKVAIMLLIHSKNIQFFVLCIVLLFRVPGFVVFDSQAVLVTPPLTAFQAGREEISSNHLWIIHMRIGKRRKNQCWSITSLR